MLQISVLLIEQDLAWASQFITVLEGFGRPFDVLHVFTAEEARHVFEYVHPDLVILDVVRSRDEERREAVSVVRKEDPVVPFVVIAGMHPEYKFLDYLEDQGVDYRCLKERAPVSPDYVRSLVLNGLLRLGLRRSSGVRRSRKSEKITSFSDSDWTSIEHRVSRFRSARSRVAELTEKSVILDGMYVELAKQKDKYKSFFDMNPCITFVVDVDGIIHDWNGAAERFYGFCKEDVIGSDYVDRFIDEDDKDTIRSKIRSVIENGKLEAYVNSVISRDGVRRLVSWNATRLPCGHLLAAGIEVYDG